MRNFLFSILLCGLCFLAWPKKSHLHFGSTALTSGLSSMQMLKNQKLNISNSADSISSRSEAPEASEAPEVLGAWFEAKLKALPNKHDLSNSSSEDLEDAPWQLREAAVQVAALYSYVAKTPSAKPLGMRFFKDCALMEEGLTPIRAYCYSKAVRIGLELGDKFWDPAELSEKLKNLARNI